jgi:hypothetical protein
VLSDSLLGPELATWKFFLLRRCCATKRDKQMGEMARCMQVRWRYPRIEKGGYPCILFFEFWSHRVGIGVPTYTATCTTTESRRGLAHPTGSLKPCARWQRFLAPLPQMHRPKGGKRTRQKWRYFEKGPGASESDRSAVSTQGSAGLVGATALNRQLRAGFIGCRMRLCTPARCGKPALRGSA